MKKINSEKGSMAVFVIIAFIFCMAILMNVYWSSTNYQITVLQAEQRIKAVYEEDTTEERMEQIHKELSKTDPI